MKIFKSILLIILSILTIPIGIVMTAGIMGYSLPLLQTTQIGLGLLNIVSLKSILGIIIGSSILFVILIILQKIFNKESGSKFKNCFIHINTGVISLVAISLSMMTFIFSNNINMEGILGTARKIGISVSAISLILFYILSGKLSKIFNRKIQAYDTAMESGFVGRSSIIGVNFLRFIEILFPEILVLSLICFCSGGNLAYIFIAILISCVIPVIGNIECDFNTRAEIKRNKEKENNSLAEKVANELKRG